ncbi:hypothetical protein BQ9231_00513 [Cedratvirus lausannensis]|uniref:Uncharacterized protein n=1 Tax=Cedratvirus lausannensis TaxID=2023205 RepID=A0A285PYX9_9VIRU|nr:hypothetical protein BQ9231_00513 [Cedratvirus lausannensis]
MSARYNRTKRILGEDPANLLRRLEERYICLCLKDRLSYGEAFDKWMLTGLIKDLYTVVSAYEKKIN